MGRLRAAVHELRCYQCRVTWKSWIQRFLGDRRGFSPGLQSMNAPPPVPSDGLGPPVDYDG